MTILFLFRGGFNGLVGRGARSGVGFMVGFRGS